MIRLYTAGQLFLTRYLLIEKRIFIEIKKYVQIITNKDLHCTLFFYINYRNLPVRTFIVDKIGSERFDLSYFLQSTFYL